MARGRREQGSEREDVAKKEGWGGGGVNGGMRGGASALSDFNSLSSLSQPIAASQLKSNQWKSLIIPTACIAVELISVPVVRPYNAKLYSFGKEEQELAHGSLSTILSHHQRVSGLCGEINVAANEMSKCGKFNRSTASTGEIFSVQCNKTPILP